MHGCMQVSVLGPEMGPLAGLLAGPESDSWQPDEIIIKSSRTGHVDRCERLHMHAFLH